MKPLYVFLIMWALFITGLCDGISWALAAIPGLGIILAFVITFCINATMGVGLLFLLITNDMYHPRFGPFLVIGGLVPGFNFLPFWLGLVGAGIAEDMSKEGGDVLGAVGSAAKAVSDFEQGKYLSATKNATRTVSAMRAPAQTYATNNAEEQEPQTRVPLNLKSPGMNTDIAPRRAANDNFSYVQKAA